MIKSFSKMFFKLFSYLWKLLTLASLCYLIWITLEAYLSYEVITEAQFIDYKSLKTSQPVLPPAISICILWNALFQYSASRWPGKYLPLNTSKGVQDMTASNSISHMFQNTPSIFNLIRKIDTGGGSLSQYVDYTTYEYAKLSQRCLSINMNPSYDMSSSVSIHLNSDSIIEGSLYLHPQNVLPYGAVIHIANIVKSAATLKTQFTRAITTRLEYPYATNCLDYSKRKMVSQARCLETCARRHGNGSVLTISVILRNDKNVKSFLKEPTSKCYEMCKRSDCYQEVYNRLSDGGYIPKFSHFAKSYVLGVSFTEYTPALLLQTIPKTSLELTVLFIAGLVGTWLGCSVLSLPDVLSSLKFSPNTFQIYRNILINRITKRFFLILAVIGCLSQTVDILITYLTYYTSDELLISSIQEP